MGYVFIIYISLKVHIFWRGSYRGMRERDSERRTERWEEREGGQGERERDKEKQRGREGESDRYKEKNTTSI